MLKTSSCGAVKLASYFPDTHTLKVFPNMAPIPTQHLKGISNKFMDEDISQKSGRNRN